MSEKRVLIIGHTNTLGGVETFIRNVVLSSDRTKVSFDFLIHDGSGTCLFKKDFNEFYKSDELEHVYHIAPFKKKPLVCMADLLKARAKHKTDYDWVHLNTGSPTEVVYAIPFLIGTQAKLISHSHIGDGHERLLNVPSRWLLNKLSRYRLACSDLAAEWLFGNKSLDDVLMVRNGIDTKRFAFSNAARTAVRDSLGIGNEFVIGHIGRFAKLKNHSRILDIFEKVNERVPDAKLCLAGTGELYGDIVSNCECRGLSQNVLFLGVRNDVNELCSAFDVFLMPSLYEGLPMVLVEAQASGLRAVVSDTISSDARIIDELFSAVSLSKPNEFWADVILRKHVVDRQKYAKLVEAKGFDTRSIARSLESLYWNSSGSFEPIGGRQL